MEWEDGSKIVPNFPFLLSGHGTYFTSSETKAKQTLIELTVNELKQGLWLCTCSNKKARRKGVETSLCCALLRKNLNQNLSDTCSMRERAARDSLMQA